MFYKYTVTWYNSYADEEMTETGLVYAKSYGNAASTVAEDYGSDNIVDIYLRQVYNEGDGACISVSELKDTFEEKDK
jgi:phage-related protein